MGQSFGVSASRVGFVAVATQVGYALGMLFFVPLGDVMERRGLIMKMFGAVTVALLLTAVAPTLGMLIAASVIVGLFAAVTHIVLPIAPDLVGDAERGRAIGIVMTGLLMGVLLARTFSGWVSHIHGWRWVFVVAAAINLAFVPLLRRKMPLLEPKANLRYADAMLSLWTLTKNEPLLRESALIGGLMFAAFSCFWTTLAFLLASHYGLGAGVAGTFGVVGAAGATVASIAGKLADKHGSRWVVGLGLATLAVSFVLVWSAVAMHAAVWLHLTGLVVGVVILDVGAQMTQIANQTRIFGLVDGARSRLNTVYMVHYFVGGAVGSWLSSLVWSRWGWDGVSALAMGFIVLAGIRHATGRKDPSDAKKFHAAEVFLEA